MQGNTNLTHKPLMISVNTRWSRQLAIQSTKKTILRGQRSEVERIDKSQVK